MLFGGFTPPAARQTTVVFFMVKKVGMIIIGAIFAKVKKESTNFNHTNHAKKQTFFQRTKNLHRN
jgi:hypothetical protein